jgi:hypothetical protein
MTLSQTDQLNNLKGSYGGSDKTSGSFLRSDYVKYNTISKARDLGTVVNYNSTITGKVGSECGTNTVYFKLKTSGSADLLITRNSLNKYEDKYISVGILGSDHKPVPRTTAGYAYQNEITNTDEKESLLQLPQDTYYFTVNNSQWQSLSYSITIRVFLYRELSGVASGTAAPYARLPLAKLFGTADWTGPMSGTIPVPSTIKALIGSASVSASPTFTLTPFAGAITGAMSPYGTIPATWRISGAITGTSDNVATLTVTSPYY